MQSTGFAYLLRKIEITGNRIPNPSLLFIYLCLFILGFSALAAWLEWKATHPVTGEAILATNLLSAYGIQRILTESVSNFTQFAPVGTVLVVVLGIGIAEHSGLLTSALKAGIQKTPRSALSATTVLLGVLSSLAADAGYVVLVPLAAFVFKAAGRNPLVGIAAAFAGVSGGFSANLLIGPLDVLLAGISTEAAHLIDANYEVSAAGNYYFILASTFLVTIVGTWVTERIVQPHFEKHKPTETKDTEHATDFTLTAEEKRGLKAVLFFSICIFGFCLWGLSIPDSILRQGEDVLRSPFMKGVVTVIALYFALAGFIFGKVSGSFKQKDDVIKGMEKNMETMASYLVLMFFAAQFVSYFQWSQLGGILAIEGANTLRSWALPPTVLLVSFVLFTATMNLFIGSATAKWALFAPVFVPMLMLVGISPEASQAAFRVGDSCTNIITPLMPYFGVVVAYAQRYQRDIGLGSIMAAMVPYSMAFLFCWTLLLACWGIFDWPLGPGAGLYFNQIE